MPLKKSFSTSFNFHAQLGYSCECQSSKQNCNSLLSPKYPLVFGVAGPAKQIPLSQINTPNVNLTIHDLEGTLELLQHAGVL